MKPRLIILLLAAAIACAAHRTQAEPAHAPLPASNGSDDVQHILYLGADGIIVLRLHVRIDGKSYRDVWNRYVDDLFRDLDTNKDNALSGREINGIPSVLDLSRMGTSPSSATVRLPTTNRNSADSRPRDGKVTRKELSDYLKRAGLKPFTVSINGQNRIPRRVIYTGRNNPTGAGAKLFDLLDTDDDGKLSKRELQRARGSLRKHDLDEDETISLAELLPPSSPFYIRRQTMNSGTAASNVFISLASGISPTRLVRQLLDRYDRADAATGATKDNKLSAAELGLDPQALAASDADGDGRLDFTELGQFLRKPAPSIELVLRLGRRRAGKPLVQLVKTSGNLKSKVKIASPSLANLALDKVNFDITTNSSRDSWSTSFARYDQLFDAADTDNNGYLEQKEVQNNGNFRAIFSSLDRDQDGKVFKKELRAYIKNQTGAASSRSVLSITDQGRDLFKILDLNRDQRLSNTELDAAIRRIDTWDTDNDRQIMKSEIPRQYRMNLERGRPGGFGNLPVAFAVYPGGPRVGGPAAGGPKWFQRMDVNGDGEVSRKEFLAKLSIFRKLDTNQNGRIDRDEAARADDISPDRRK